jgi:hypothetical protein
MGFANAGSVEDYTGSSIPPISKPRKRPVRHPYTLVHGTPNSTNINTAQTSKGICRDSFLRTRCCRSTMKAPRAKLDALLALLNSAAQDAIAEYERTGDVPSTESAHSLDAQPPSLVLRNALRVLEGACEQLCTTLAPPVHTLLNVSISPYCTLFSSLYQLICW